MLEKIAHLFLNNEGSMPSRKVNRYATIFQVTNHFVYAICRIVSILSKPSRVRNCLLNKKIGQMNVFENFRNDASMSFIIFMIVYLTAQTIPFFASANLGGTRANSQ